MVMSRVIALMMISAGAAAQAQQQPAAPAQPAASVVTQDNSQKVTCRVHMEGNLPKRVCMKNEEWKKIDGQAQNGLDSSYVNRARCTSLGAC